MTYEKGRIRTDRGLFIDKGNQVVDVRHEDFDGGAKGDGATDDTAAIRAAALFLSQLEDCGKLFFPAGTYLISAPVFYYSNQEWIFAPGASIKLKDSSVASLVSTATGATLVGMVQPSASGLSGVRFRGMKLDGNKANNPTANSGNGLDLYAVSDVEVTDIELVDIPRDGLVVSKIGAATSSNVYIRGLKATDVGVVGVNGGNGVAIVAGANIHLSDFDVDSAWQFGVNVEPNAGAADEVVGVTIRDGRIRDTWKDTGHGLSIYSPTDFAINGITVEDVDISGCGAGFVIHGSYRALNIRARNVRARTSRYQNFQVENGLRCGFEECQGLNPAVGQAANTVSNWYIHGTDMVLYHCRADDTTAQAKHGFEEAIGTQGTVFDRCVVDGALTSSFNIIGSRSQITPSEQVLLGSGLGYFRVTERQAGLWRLGPNLDRLGDARLDTSIGSIFFQFDMRTAASPTLTLRKRDSAGSETVLATWS